MYYSKNISNTTATIARLVNGITNVNALLIMNGSILIGCNDGVYIISSEKILLWIQRGTALTTEKIFDKPTFYLMKVSDNLCIASNDSIAYLITFGSNGNVSSIEAIDFPAPITGNPTLVRKTAICSVATASINNANLVWAGGNGLYEGVISNDNTISWTRIDEISVNDLKVVVGNTVFVVAVGYYIWSYKRTVSDDDNTISFSSSKKQNDANTLVLFSFTETTTDNDTTTLTGLIACGSDQSYYATPDTSTSVSWTNVDSTSSLNHTMISLDDSHQIVAGNGLRTITETATYSSSWTVNVTQSSLNTKDLFDSLLTLNATSFLASSTGGLYYGTVSSLSKIVDKSQMRWTEIASVETVDTTIATICDDIDDFTSTDMVNALNNEGDGRIVNYWKQNAEYDDTYEATKTTYAKNHPTSLELDKTNSITFE